MLNQHEGFNNEGATLNEELSMQINNEKGHFLSKAQKEVKQKIMERLFTIIPVTLLEEGVAFDAQALADLNGSILIMFSRDMLINFIEKYNIPPQDISNFLDHILGTIKDGVLHDLMSTNNISH